MKFEFKFEYLLTELNQTKLNWVETPFRLNLIVFVSSQSSSIIYSLLFRPSFRLDWAVTLKQLVLFVPCVTYLFTV